MSTEEASFELVHVKGDGPASGTAPEAGEVDESPKREKTRGNRGGVKERARKEARERTRLGMNNYNNRGPMGPRGGHRGQSGRPVYSDGSSGHGGRYNGGGDYYGGPPSGPSPFAGQKFGFFSGAAPPSAGFKHVKCDETIGGRPPAGCLASMGGGGSSHAPTPSALSTGPRPMTAPAPGYGGFAGAAPAPRPVWGAPPQRDIPPLVPPNMQQPAKETAPVGSVHELFGKMVWKKMEALEDIMVVDRLQNHIMGLITDALDNQNKAKAAAISQSAGASQSQQQQAPQPVPAPSGMGGGGGQGDGYYAGQQGQMGDNFVRPRQPNTFSTSTIGSF